MDSAFHRCFIFHVYFCIALISHEFDAMFCIEDGLGTNGFGLVEFQWNVALSSD
jgi:hypothetical protein